MESHDGGKLRVESTVPVRDRDDLAMVYTPGVARVCLAIRDDPASAYDLTIKRNSVAIVSDGTAVLGLGDIGPAGRDAGHGGQGAAAQGAAPASTPTRCAWTSRTPTAWST